MKQFFALLLCLIATPTLAQDPMNGAEFDAYVTGKTLVFAQNGVAYGAEQYLPDQKVRWAFDQDTCKYGLWYEQDEAICFLYEDGTPPQCWQFFLSGGKLRAEFQGDSGTELYEAWTSNAPLSCMGPQVGV